MNNMLGLSWFVANKVCSSSLEIDMVTVDMTTEWALADGHALLAANECVLKVFFLVIGFKVASPRAPNVIIELGEKKGKKRKEERYI